MINFKIGIEVECIINKDIMKNLKIGMYHRGAINPGLVGWKIERDGSLFKVNDFINCYEAEVVSNVIKTKTDYDKKVNAFKKFFSKNGRQELNQVLSFNRSCGNHVHFEIEGFKFSEKVYKKIFPMYREKLFDLLKASNIQSKQEIIDHYDRDYAKKFTERDIKEYNRRCEFNFSSELEGKGLELRGINLKGIKTWLEFKEMFNIIYQSLEYFQDIATKYSVNIDYKVKLPVIKNNFSKRVDVNKIDIDNVKRVEVEI